MRIFESQLRMIVRQEILREVGGSDYADDRALKASASPVTFSRPATTPSNMDVLEITEELLGGLDKILLGTDLVLIGLTAATGGAAALATMPISKGLGVVGGVVNFAETAVYFAEGKNEEAAWSLVSGIVSILSTPAAGRAGTKAVKYAIELSPVAIQAIETLINKISPGNEDANRRAVQESLAKIRAGKLSASNPAKDLFDLTQPIDDKAYDDSQDGEISQKEDVTDHLAAMFPRYSQQIEDSSEIIYEFYLKCRGSYVTQSDASITAPGKRRSGKSSAKKSQPAGTDLKAASDWRFNADGTIYKRSATGGGFSPIGDAYNALSLKPGSSLTGGFTLVKSQIDDQGRVIRLIIKGPGGVKLEVPSIGG